MNLRTTGALLLILAASAGVKAIAQDRPFLSLAPTATNLSLQFYLQNTQGLVNIFQAPSLDELLSGRRIVWSGLLSTNQQGGIFVTNDGTAPGAFFNLTEYPGMEPAGMVGSNRYVVPVNQVVTPAGRQVLMGRRPYAVEFSPDGQLLAVAGTAAQLLLLHPVTGTNLQRLNWPAGSDTNTAIPEPEGQLSYTGLRFSPSGTRVFLSSALGGVRVFRIDTNHVAAYDSVIELPPTGLSQWSTELPSGLAVSADEKRLYVALNISNRLLEYDLESGQPARLFDVGVAPYAVALVGQKAYVSNWGGRRADTNSVRGPAGLGTEVRVDPVRYIANEGSVTVIDLAAGEVTGEILVGLHACDLAVTPDGGYIVVANANSDTVSVIDTHADEVVETINVKWQPTDPYGAAPNAMVFNGSGDTLYVCNGGQNAVTVIAFSPPASRLLGMIPVGWYPGALDFDVSRQTLCVANIKGHGSRARPGPGGRSVYNVLDALGTLSFVPVPDQAMLDSYTRIVLTNYQQGRILDTALPPRLDALPKSVPERVGEPSVFRHVVYIIKENRTYDQVLGDMVEGNGDPELCVFGEEVTPNHHQLAREFVLLDNTYCSGILSVEGHQWADSAMASDYVEKAYGAFVRSYPTGMNWEGADALAYSPAGFLWDSALAGGKTVRVYGEFTVGDIRWAAPGQTNTPRFVDVYNDWVNQTSQVGIGSQAVIESLRPYVCTNTIGWSLLVPDVVRADRFIAELRGFETNGTFPELSILLLPNDHTAGTRPGMPTPEVYLADNDLALGRIVEAISTSSFWQDTCIFVIEDDPQDGWDHVSAFRTVAYVISPYTRRHVTLHTAYNQTGVLRTMELILGLPPLNQMDATALPMFDCFTDTPDFTPYVAVSNAISFAQTNPPAAGIADPLLRAQALLSEKLPLDKVDQCPEGVFNRILWHARKGPSASYPGRADEENDRGD